jgi:hypothetical protein
VVSGVTSSDGGGRGISGRAAAPRRGDHGGGRHLHRRLGGARGVPARAQRPRRGRRHARPPRLAGEGRVRHPPPARVPPLPHARAGARRLQRRRRRLDRGRACLPAEHEHGRRHAFPRRLRAGPRGAELVRDRPSDPAGARRRPRGAARERGLRGGSETLPALRPRRRAALAQRDGRADDGHGAERVPRVALRRDERVVVEDERGLVGARPNRRPRHGARGAGRTEARRLVEAVLDELDGIQSADRELVPQ